MSQYKDLIRNILNNGDVVETRQGITAKTLMQQTMCYDLAFEFPVITERSMIKFWKKPINELMAFINGATTVTEFEAFGCDWWGPWATPEKCLPKGIPTGSLGPGSYGAAFAAFPPTAFDQFEHLVENLQKYPNDRTHFITPWIPQYNQRDDPKTTISPCHGWVHLRVINKKLNLHMFQRSADVPIGVPSNMIQYAALALMLCSLTGYRPGKFYHTLSDAHIYEDQQAACWEMLARPDIRLPLAVVTKEHPPNLKEFTADHFELLDYHPHLALKIPVSV